MSILRIQHVVACVAVMAGVFVHGQDYCMNAGPGSFVDSTVGACNMQGESGTGFNTQKDCDGDQGTLHVNDRTASDKVTLKMGQTYTLNWGADTCGMAYFKAGRVWVDWGIKGFMKGNRHDEDALADIYSEPAGESWAQSTSFTVPDDCSNGETRMRILVTEDENINTVEPCAEFGFGGITDFGVTLEGCKHGPGGGGGLSGGSIFLIILLVGGFVYLAGGVAFNVKKKGMPLGVDAVPQIDFWRTIPGLTKAGCLWSKARIQEKMNGDKYAAVDDI